MSSKPLDANAKKQVLLVKLSKIQSKLENIDKQRAEKITKLAKKFKLLDLDEKIIEQEFSLIKEKYLSASDNNARQDPIKKN